MIRELRVLIVILGVSTSALAAPPEVTSLFPAGAQRGSSVPVTIQGKLGDGTCRAWCNQHGINVTFPEKPGPLTVSVGADAQPGVCWLRFYNDDGAAGLRPFVIGTCHEVNETEPNDEIVKAEPLPELPVVVNGQHGKNGDADLFGFALRRGQTVVASLMANRTIGSPQDAVLQVLGPDGFVLSQNEDDQGFDPQLTFTAPADGLYAIRTWAFPATPDASIRLFGSPACVYRLLITTGPFIDHVSPAIVQAGVSQRIRLHGWNLTQKDLELTPPVSAINRSFDWPLEEWTNRLPVTVRVQSEATAVEVEPNPLNQPQVLPLPIHVTGEISMPRDVDAFQFTATKGQHLRCEVTARDAGSPLDPVLRIYDSAGKKLQEADDDGKQSADPDVEFTAPADGEYRVTITDRFLHHGDRFFYRLSLAPPQPDFSLSVAADAFQLSGAMELEIPVTVNRTGGFAGEIQIRAMGLPLGVVAEPVISESKGDSAKSVKLKLKSNGQVTSSDLFQIVGRPNGSVIQERLATMSLRVFQAEPSDLWLTIKK